MADEESRGPVIYVDSGPSGVAVVKPVQRVRQFHIVHGHFARAACQPIPVPVRGGRVRLWIEGDTVPDIVTVGFFHSVRRALMFPLEIDDCDLTAGHLHAVFASDGARHSVTFDVSNEDEILRVTTTVTGDEHTSVRYVLRLEA